MRADGADPPTKTQAWSGLSPRFVTVKPARD